MCFEVGVLFFVCRFVFPLFLKYLNPNYTEKMSSLTSLMRAERARAHINREIKSAKKYKKKGLWCAFVDFLTS